MALPTPARPGAKSRPPAARRALAAAMRGLAALLRDRRGISAMEYAALGVAIVVTIVTAVAALGAAAAGMFTSAASGL